MLWRRTYLARVFVATILLLIILQGCSEDEQLEQQIIQLKLELEQARDHIESLEADSDGEDTFLEDSSLQNNFAKFHPDLEDDNIDGKYTSGGSSLWGSQSYNEYIRIVLQRVLFTEDYYWLDEIHDNDNPVEAIRSQPDMERHLLGIEFNRPVTSYVQQLPADIKEIWFFIKDDDRRLIIRTEDQTYYSYEVFDSSLLVDFHIISVVLDAMYERNFDVR